MDNREALLKEHAEFQNRVAKTAAQEMVDAGLMTRAEVKEGFAGEPTARPLLQVETQAQRMDALLDVIDEAACLLVDRLIPILSEPVPVSGETPMSGVDPNQCPLAVTLASQCNRVEQCALLLSMARERMQI